MIDQLVSTETSLVSSRVCLQQWYGQRWLSQHRNDRYFASGLCLRMSDRTRNKKIAPKAEVNEYKKQELVAAAKETGLKVVALPENMLGKGEFWLHVTGTGV